MELKNIFKMEMFKNRNDKPYLLVIAILAAMAAVASIVGVLMIEKVIDSDRSTLFVIEILLIVFTVVGLGVFSLIYPFHLLNVDYKNKVISLIFASGVSRGKYYFVKISATILSTLTAVFVILFIPMVTFLFVYPDAFVEAVQTIIKEFSSADIFSFVLSITISFIATIVMLTTAVIITKGKVAGIFLFLAFSFAASTIQSIISVPLIFTMDNFYADYYFNFITLFSIIQTVIFVLIGLSVLKKQNL